MKIEKFEFERATLRLLISCTRLPGDPAAPGDPVRLCGPAGEPIIFGGQPKEDQQCLLNGLQE